MTNEPEPNTRAGEALKLCSNCGFSLADDGGCYYPYCCEPQKPNTRPLPQPSELVEAKTFTHEELARIYRRAQLTAEEKLCREQANSEGLKRRTKVLEAQLAKLQADGDKLAGALEAFQRHYDLNDCDERCGALEVPISDLRRATQALTEWKDRA